MTLIIGNIKSYCSSKNSVLRFSLYNLGEIYIAFIKETIGGRKLEIVIEKFYKTKISSIINSA